jgi:hypothetical protein
MLYSTKEASRYLANTYGIRRSYRTLQKYRSIGGGPRYHRISAVEVMYHSESLDEYARSLIGPAIANTAQELANKQTGCG